MEIENKIGSGREFAKLIAVVLVAVVWAASIFCALQSEYKKMNAAYRPVTTEVSAADGAFMAYAEKMDAIAMARSQRLLACGDTAAALEMWSKYSNQ